jgi:hypothetical protein
MAGKHRSTTRAGRARRIALSALGAVALASAGLAVGFAGTGGTYAAWNSSITANSATIASGSSAIQLGMTANGAFADTLDLSGPSGTLGPGVTVVSPFAVKNTGTTSVALGATITPGSAASLEGALRVAVVAVNSSTGCTTGLASRATSPLASYSATGLPQLAVHTTQMLCLVLTVPTNDSSSAGGQTAPFTVNISGNQVTS